MSHSNEKLTLTVYLMNHSYMFPWKVDGTVRLKIRMTKSRVKVPKTGAELKKLHGDDILLERTVEVWHKDSSHFVTQSTGTCESRGDPIEEDEDMGEGM